MGDPSKIMQVLPEAEMVHRLGIIGVDIRASYASIASGATEPSARVKAGLQQVTGLTYAELMSATEETSLELDSAALRKITYPEAT